MRWLLMLAIAAAPLAVPRPACAQAVADSLPERVVVRAYAAFNRHDAAAYYALFAPVWYHSVMEDSSQAVTRRTRDEAIRALPEVRAARGHQPRETLKVVRRIALGPYVVDEQALTEVGVVHLDMFEVRHGQIVHQRESDNYSGWRRGPWRP